MKFTRMIKREITIKSTDPALEDSTWIVHMHANGVNVRRKGESVEQLFLSWRSVIGTALIFKGRQK